ncbi:MAG: glycosyltransferase family 4 protein [Pseudomonadales bacterium]|nr:glycosyltransferase family 4 protein [Pseudomonadales bacterium]MBH2078100.1 glycosyltransferase family 4 protein [Pseudomonadales bacterium]
MQTLNKCLGYDSRWVGQHGIGRFAAEIKNRLEFNHHFDDTKSPTGPLSSIHLGRWLERSGAKALYTPGYIPPIGTRLPFVFTIHDLNHIDIPHNSSISKKLYYQLIIRPAIDRAYKVLTVSEYSKKRILEWADCDEEKIRVVGNGISESFFSNSTAETPGYAYFFCCSNRKGHKNEKRLIHAFAQSQLGNDIKLVITGDIDADLHNTINKHKLHNKVLFTGRVSEEKLAALYKGALATVFPSIYEGFGLPVIESMACGTPVIASNTTSLPEVGGQAAYYFDPYNIESISDAMLKLANDDELRREMRANGFLQAKNYSWEKTAKSVSAALDGII